MAVQYSIQKMVSDGTLSTIVLGIQYLQRNDVYMRIAGEETPQSGAASGYTWTFLDNTTLKITPVVPNGVEVVVYRRTDIDSMYNIYSQNAQFDESTIDENNQQLLYIAQEYLEQGIPGTGVEALEYVNTLAGINYYRFKLTDGSYTPVFGVPDGTAALRSELSNVDGVSLVGSASYADIRAYGGAADTIHCFGNTNIFDGQHGTFVFDTSDTTSPDDGVTVLVSSTGRRYKRQYAGPLLPRFAGVVGDAVVDDYASCASLIAAFKKRGVIAAGGIDMRGDGIDWTGYKCRLSQKLDLSGLFNYNFTNPTFIAHSTFSGTALLKIDSDHTYLVSGITWINPQLDGAWLADYCVEAYDFLKWSLIGGKLTHYKKKGFITGTINDAPHEINAIGTFFFQREFNETYPPSITEGEAFFVDNYDNEFTNIVVGYHKQWAFTLNKGANRFVGGHVYTGWKSDPLVGGVRSLDNGDDFIGTYFDNTWVKMNARSSANGCQFLVGTATGAVAAILDNDPFQVKMTDCRFKKLGANTQVISMPTVAAGRTSRPDIYDNEYENCSGITTRGPWFTGLNVSSLVIPVPDQFLPLGNFSMPGRAASATGALADRLCGASYDAATNNMTINTYKILPDGTVTPSVLNGSMVMNMNV